MNTLTPPASGPAPTVLGTIRSALDAWNRFWFTPADPTLLALIRICCGAVCVYTLIAYTADLQEFFGKYAWFDLETRSNFIHNGPVAPTPWNWERPLRREDLGLLTDEQVAYGEAYYQKWRAVPPLPFPTTKEEADAIDEYRAFWGYDPRTLLGKGTPVWSVWYDVTDPAAMMAIHLVFIGILVLFTIGFCTRITSVLAWFAFLNYVHRSSIMLFGVDTMTVIVLMYLMIAPCGAVLSVDRLLARWWAVRGPRVAARWRAFWERARGRAPSVNPDDVPLGTPLPAQPAPSVSANLALRLLQIHVCIIYAAAGFAKLQGAAWWQGTAVWGTLANFELAPMQYPLYQAWLRAMTRHRLLLEVFLTGGTFFTLFFEVCYPFLIWNRSTRWLMLAMALTLHGIIGTFMGLKTFSLMMLAMNMAFLPPETVQWLLRPLHRLRSSGPQRPETPAEQTTGPRPALATAVVSVSGAPGGKL